MEPEHTFWHLVGEELTEPILVALEQRQHARRAARLIAVATGDGAEGAAVQTPSGGGDLHAVNQVMTLDVRQIERNRVEVVGSDRGSVVGRNDALACAIDRDQPIHCQERIALLQRKGILDGR